LRGFAACITSGWGTFKVTYRYSNTLYQIDYMHKKESGAITLKPDGAATGGNAIELIDDGVERNVEVNLFTGKT
jgi:hypothetical protein